MPCGLTPGVVFHLLLMKSIRILAPDVEQPPQQGCEKPWRADNDDLHKKHLKPMS
jgi:hypothetical protein